MLSTSDIRARLAAAGIPEHQLGSYVESWRQEFAKGTTVAEFDRQLAATRRTVAPPPPPPPPSIHTAPAPPSLTLNPEPAMIPFLPGLLGAGGLVGKIGAVAGVVGSAAAGIGSLFGGSKTLPPKPSYGSPPGPPALPGGRQPAPGVTGIITRLGERIIPGGRTGRELTPYEGTERDKLGRPIAVHPDTTSRLYAPPGYVIVNMGTAESPMPLAVLKGVARSMGLWKPRPKPPISGYDARAIRRAQRAQTRVKKLAGDVGLRMALPAAGKGRFKKKARSR